MHDNDDALSNSDDGTNSVKLVFFFSFEILKLICFKIESIHFYYVNIIQNFNKANLFLNRFTIFIQKDWSQINMHINLTL